MDVRFAESDLEMMEVWPEVPYVERGGWGKSLHI